MLILGIETSCDETGVAVVEDGGTVLSDEVASQIPLHARFGGVVPEIQYRIGQKITRTKLVNLDTLLISTGTIREVPDKSVRACRTQIVTEVGDAAKMVRNWGGGVLEGDMMTLLHRVVFYGDHLQSSRHLADLMNMQVVEEG